MSGDLGAEKWLGVRIIDLCACSNARPHPWEPGEACPPVRVVPPGERIQQRAEEMLAEVEGIEWKDATVLQHRVWLRRARAALGGDE